MVNGMQRIPAGDERLNNALPLLLLSLLGVGLSGVMMTVSRYAYRRWPAPTPNIRFLRQGFWSALFSVICGWLLINRAFTLVPVTLLASALVLIELFFVVRESPRVQNLKRSI
jgi:cell division protein FtsW (lipid II flippase)